MDASGSIMLIKQQRDALLEVLQDNGDSVTLDVGADGVTRAGVTFTCMSAYPCTVTVSNSAGTIVAMWASQTLGDGTASAMASGREPLVDTFAALTPGNTESIRVDVVGVNADANTVGPNLTPTELIGMGIGGPGVTPEQAMPGLRSDFQANGGDFVDVAGAVLSPQPPAGAAPGAEPNLMGGTTLSGATMPDGDAISASDDMEMAPAGWAMKTLFRDWGDTAGDGDGGFETAAIVVKNLGEGTPYPFDRKLSDKFVNDAAKAMFALTLRANGAAPGVTTLATSVDINSDATADNTATAMQWEMMVFDDTSLVPAQSQDPNIDEMETFTGTYFGAPGQFQCIEADDADPGCGIARNADDVVMVVDTGAAAGIQGGGRWTFTPDDGAMITVPDQDWMAYGAWLTTPDDMSGDHRLGVFFNGMDTYKPIANSFTVGNAVGLRGTATYSGGATGVYVDGADSGLFTARAMLTAKFDADNDGLTDAGEYSISGRIDNFRGTNGVALGADTGDMPNPQGRGENDWVVELGTFPFTTATADGGTALAITATATSGSADGVSWEGMWNGMFFGPATDADEVPIHPSGVAGQFWAETDDLDAANTDADVADNPVTAVVGAFGASKDD